MISQVEPSYEQKGIDMLRVTEIHRFLRPSYGDIKILVAVRAAIAEEGDLSFAKEKIFSPEEWVGLLAREDVLYREDGAQKFRRLGR